MYGAETGLAEAGAVLSDDRSRPAARACTFGLALAFALDGPSLASVAPLVRLLTSPAIVLIDVRPVVAIALVGIPGFLFRIFLIGVAALLALLALHGRLPF